MAGEIGYLTIAEADAYFVKRLSAAAWTSIVIDSGNSTKTAALTTAFDRLFYFKPGTLPVLEAASAEQLVRLKKAQCEMALYLLVHLAGEDRRKGLQVQGVKAAGVVQETYAETELASLPVPAIVANLLEDFWREDGPFYARDIDRDENESVKTDVTDL